jgi:hypothetical protein
MSGEATRVQARTIHRSAWKVSTANFALKLSEKGYE